MKTKLPIVPRKGGISQLVLMGRTKWGRAKNTALTGTVYGKEINNGYKKPPPVIMFFAI